MRKVLICVPVAAVVLAGLLVTGWPASADTPSTPRTSGASGTPGTPGTSSASGSSSTSSTNGTFSVLSYNIAGLPDMLSSAPTPRAPRTTTIGERLNKYDIVNVQEDFNFNSHLYKADSHRYRTPTSGIAGVGSGLNTLSNLAFDQKSVERVRWSSCSIGSGDCLTPKGFTVARIHLADDVSVDVYNLHSDAGNSSGDLKARAKNLTQLGAFIASHSKGQAVLVMGDTNTRYTRAGDTIASFARDQGLTDAWVQLIRGGKAPGVNEGVEQGCGEVGTVARCEVVDKILYRGNARVSLTATSYGNEHPSFREDSGAALSDHDPIMARFTWSKT